MWWQAERGGDKVTGDDAGDHDDDDEDDAKCMYRVRGREAVK